MKPNTNDEHEHQDIVNRKQFMKRIKRELIVPSEQIKINNSNTIKLLSKGELYEIYYNSGKKEGIKQGYAKAIDDVKHKIIDLANSSMKYTKDDEQIFVWKVALHTAERQIAKLKEKKS